MVGSLYSIEDVYVAREEYRLQVHLPDRCCYRRMSGR
jgi:hypothetical protein